MDIKAKISLIIACLFWAASFIATKVALSEIPPLTVVTLRLIVSALCFIFWMKLTGEKLDLFTFSNMKYLLLLSIFGTGLHYGIQTIGLQFTTASKGGIYSVTAPITIIIIAALFLKEKITLKKGIGVLIALVGVIVVMGLDTISEFNLKGNLLGDLFVLISIIMWGIFTVLSKSFTIRMSPLKMTTAITVIGALYMIPVGLIEMGTRSFSIYSISMEGWMAIFFLGITCSFLATLLYVYALSLSESQKVGVYLYTVPPMTHIIAFFVLGESIGLSLIVGSSLVLYGVFLTEKG